MAINPESLFAGKIDPSTPEYPYGSARNVTTPGDGTGTPWEAALVNDLFGFQQSLLSESAIVPSGTPDNAITSQYLNAVLKLFSRTVENYVDMRALDSAKLTDGAIISVSDVDTGGIFEVKTGTVADNDGTLIVFSDNANRYAQRVLGNGVVSVKWFGAKGDGVLDDSTAIQAALDNHDSVFVPQGVYRCDTMITVGLNKRLQADTSTIMIRTTDTDNTDPVVWLSGQKSVFIGGGASTQIQSDNKCPTGVVRVGHENITVSHENVNYCQLRNMYIRGSVSGGQTSGIQDSAVYMANPQLSGLTSYFNWLSDLQIGYANYGIRMRGWCNANHITDIHAFRCGNDSIQGAAIFIEGGQENTIKGVFHHNSPNSNSLIFDDLDNTSNGGSNHVPSFNMVDGYVAEQGGTQEIGLFVPSSCNGTLNRVRIHSNTSLGNDVFVGFKRDNDFQDQDISRSVRPVAFAAYDGAADSLKDNFGIASVTRLANGSYRFFFDANLGDSNYLVQCSVTDRNDNLNVTTINVTDKNTDSFDVKVIASNNTTLRTVVNADDVNVIVFRKG